jgi:tRNA (adenine22-N1)-methyltransferase
VGEAGGIILSGMGAPLMISILQRGIDVARSADYLVLSPHTYPERLRSFLGSSGFAIKTEEIAEEGGKYYIIMKVSASTEEPYSLCELLLGRHVCPSLNRLKYLKYKIFQYRRIVERAKGAAREEEAVLWLRIYEAALEDLEG